MSGGEEGGQTVADVLAAQAGDDAARGRLFERHLPHVRQIVALRLGRRLGQMMDCEDVVQDTMLAALRDLPDYRPGSVGQFRNWLSTLVQRRIQNHWRGSLTLKRGEGGVRSFSCHRSSVLTDSMFAGDGPTPSQVAEGQELEEKLEEALLALPADLRQVFERRRLCEMSFEEIAAEHELSVSAVKRRFYQSLNALSRGLGLESG